MAADGSVSYVQWAIVQRRIMLPLMFSHRPEANFFVSWSRSQSCWRSTIWLNYVRISIAMMKFSRLVLSLSSLHQRGWLNDRRAHKSTLKDILKLLLDPSVKVPELYAVDLSRLPPVVADHCDVSAILKELHLLRHEVRMMSQLKDEVDDL